MIAEKIVDRRQTNLFIKNPSIRGDDDHLPRDKLTTVF